MGRTLSVHHAFKHHKILPLDMTLLLRYNLAYFCYVIVCAYIYFLCCFLAFSKKQWTTLVTGRYMITMMMLLCYVNLSGMSLECIVIVLMNNSLLGGQTCTDYVNIEQDGRDQIGHDRLAIIPRLNFTCNGRITSIRARMRFEGGRDNYPFFQVWRLASTVYTKIGEVQLQSDDQVTGSGDYRTTNTILTGNNTIEFQSGDVVGYYHPPNARYRVRTIRTDGYILYQFNGSPSTSVNLSGANDNDNKRQPLIQFTIGKCAFTKGKNYVAINLL